MSLADIATRWSGCFGCALRRTCRQPVVGELLNSGDAYEGSILVVGLSPARADDAATRPFMGEAGKLLRDGILWPADVTSAYLTSLVACRPPGREPLPLEVSACSVRIRELVEEVRPAGVLFVGLLAEQLSRHGPFVSELPWVTIVDPAALIARGYPTDATKKTLAVQVAKVKRLIARSQSKPRKKKAAEPEEAPVVDVGCRHQIETVGVWRSDDADSAMTACIVCGVLA